MIFKVGKKYKKDNKRITFSYRNVKTDGDGWVDAKKYHPADYDIVYIRPKNKPTMTGWHCGEWIGLRLKDTDEVLYWKKKRDERVV